MTLNIALFGCAPDTGNLGVSALCDSTLDALAERIPGVEITVFGNGRGLGELRALANGGRATTAGAWLSKRLHRPEAIARIRLSNMLGGFGSPSSRSFIDADVVLDISGGDSFTDLYGPRRFRTVWLPKQMAREARKPLVLLPQTYGPWSDPEIKSRASAVTRYAEQAWARDERSYSVMREMLGGSFDESRHRLGVDVAFLLRPDENPPAEAAEHAAWAEEHSAIGFNVSGLLYNDPEGARTRYGFRADYREVVRRFVTQMAENAAPVLLVPHVLGDPAVLESDNGAAAAVLRDLGDFGGRVRLASGYSTARAVKSVIRRCDWFCGMRMHATIAGLSSGVPTSAIAYSPKTLGVFETCGQGYRVVDPRELDTDDVVAGLVRSYETRDHARVTLSDHLPTVKARAAAQADEIVAACTGASAGAGDAA